MYIRACIVMGWSLLQGALSSVWKSHFRS